MYDIIEHLDKSLSEMSPTLGNEVKVDPTMCSVFASRLITESPCLALRLTGFRDFRKADHCNPTSVLRHLSFADSRDADLGDRPAVAYRAPRRSRPSGDVGEYGSQPRQAAEHRFYSMFCKQFVIEITTLVNTVFVRHRQLFVFATFIAIGKVLSGRFSSF